MRPDRYKQEASRRYWQKKQQTKQKGTNKHQPREPKQQLPHSNSHETREQEEHDEGELIQRETRDLNDRIQSFADSMNSTTVKLITSAMNRVDMDEEPILSNSSGGGGGVLDLQRLEFIFKSIPLSDRRLYRTIRSKVEGEQEEIENDLKPFANHRSNNNNSRDKEKQYAKEEVQVESETKITPQTTATTITTTIITSHSTAEQGETVRHEELENWLDDLLS